MVTVFYFLLLLAASAEDYKSHKVNRYVVLSIWLLGLVNIVIEKENRWVTLSLTCVCFIVLYVCYVATNFLAKHRNERLRFGGADVRLIPAMMLVQGWDVALLGVFIGLCSAVVRHLVSNKKNNEIPLVPWMSAGCILVEIFYLFFGKSML